jgi:hypothetical protein
MGFIGRWGSDLSAYCIKYIFWRLCRAMWEDPKVFSHNHGSVPVGLDIQDGIELLDGIANVNPIFEIDTFRNPKQTMESHDVVDAEHAGVGELVTDGLGEVAVSLLAAPLRVQGRKSPILSAGEDGIGR